MTQQIFVSSAVSRRAGCKLRYPSNTMTLARYIDTGLQQSYRVKFDGQSAPAMHAT